MASMQAFVIPEVGKLLNQNPDFRNIREIRKLETVQGMNFYSIGEGGIRIELIWEIGKDVKVWDFKNDTQLPEGKAFVVFSGQVPQNILPPDIQEKVDIKVLDYYDYNRVEKGKSRFKKYVSLVTPKH